MGHDIFVSKRNAFDELSEVTAFEVVFTIKVSFHHVLPLLGVRGKQHSQFEVHELQVFGKELDQSRVQIKELVLRSKFFIINGFFNINTYVNASYSPHQFEHGLQGRQYQCKVLLLLVGVDMFL